MNDTILAYPIPEHARLGTLPRHFGRHMMTFEGFAYDLLRQFAPKYGGGRWAFIELTNGSLYMRPPGARYRLSIPSNGYEGAQSADATGITVCLMAYSLLSFEHRDTDVFTEHFHGLRAFALDHVESAEIFAAID